MPSEYYCADNFYKKMTDLDSPKKNNDCYFYYYSKCTKGDNCTFRHEPSALGCETMCSFWKEGKCMNVHCNFRHMELRKNRKVIQCYWETQPGGCLKSHCPFMHQHPRPGDEEDLLNKTDSDQDKLKQGQANDIKNSVDSLVVNFEEESDSESAPTFSPTKAQHRNVKVKTLEEIRLEKVQAESAAFYSYLESKDQNKEEKHEDEEDLRQRLIQKTKLRPNTQNINKRLADMEEEESVVPKKQKLNRPSKPDIQDIKIKTLHEIRAEKLQKLAQEGEKRSKDELEVSSTSTDDVSMSPVEDVSPKRKIKLRRRPLANEEVKVCSLDDKDEENQVLQKENSLERSDSNKTDDEVLLLDGDDEYGNVSMKTEDDLLNEIDYLLNE